MEEQNQQLLVSNGSVGCEDHAKPRCCNAQGTVAGMVDSTHSPRRGSCGCGQPRAPFTKFRQISVTSGDSGIGMSLDPISESCYTEENELDNTGEKCMRWTRANLSRETQNCGEHNCGLANNSLQNSETRLVFKGLQCERDQTNPKEIVSGDSRLVDAFALRKSCMIGNRRVRTLSEGCAGYNCVHAIGETISTGDMRLQISQQESPQSKISPNEQSHPADFKNSENYKGINRRQYKSLRRIAVLAVIVALFSAGAAIFVYTNHDAQLDEMKNKILKLEEALNQTNSRTLALPSAGAVQAIQRNVPNRPHIHLVMDEFKHSRTSKWNAKILHWTPELEEGDGMHYDADKSTIVIRQPGAYFVYNQIYALRVSTDSGTGKKDEANHTVMNIIYKIPFNYPRSRKPRTVAESALSHCRNENADAQIHASYQGVIVNMGRNEELLVGLEHYNENVDKLRGSATFFGVFKL